MTRALLLLSTLLLTSCGSSPAPPTDDDDDDVTAGDDDDADPGGTPIVYFVVHADPASTDAIKDTSDCSTFASGTGRWDRLVALTDAIAARNAGRPADAQHRITLMFTPGWAWVMASSPCAAEAQAQLAAWVDAGHEIALHSHSTTHKFRDGYSNEIGWVRDDVDEDDAATLCAEAPPASAPDGAWQTQCSVDRGLLDLGAALEEATGSAYDVRWARIGPLGNGDPSSNPQADDCVLPGGGDADDAIACIDREWTGEVAASIEHTTLAYDVDHCGRDAPGAVRGGSECSTWGDAPGPLYGVPHAPLRTESGELRVSIERLAEDLRAAADGDLVGVVVHPASYTSVAAQYSDRTFCDDAYSIADPAAYIDAVFDLLDGEPVALGAGVLTDNPTHGAGGCDCDVAPAATAVEIDALPAAVPSVTLSEARAADLAGTGDDCD